MTKYILAFLILFVFHKAQSQRQIAQHYTMSNGLPSNEVFSVLKDKRGYTWFATDGGVCRFDGKNFKTFTTNEGLAENTILEIKEDKHNRIWCRGYSGSFTIIDKDSLIPINISAEIKRHKIDAILFQFELDDSLNLYLTSRFNAIVYKSTYPYKVLSPVALPKSSISFLQINNNKHIISFEMGMVENKQDIKVAIALAHKTLQVPINISSLKNEFFLKYLFTPQHLIISLDQEIIKIDIVTKKVTTQHIPFRVSALAILSDTTFWVGGFQGEVGIVNIKTNSFKLLDNYPSAISNIYSENNACWLTTLKNGVYYIPNTNYTVVHENKEPLISMLPIANDSIYILNSNSKVTLITKKKEEVLPNINGQKHLMYWQHFDKSQNEYIPLVGCYNYLIEKSTDKKIYFDLKEKSKWTQTEFVVPIDTTIYASFYGGLKVFNFKSKKLKHLISHNKRTTCLFGNNGVLYIGSQQGAYKLENNSVVPLDTHSYFKNRVESIDKIDETNLVIATQAHGIGIYNLKTKQLTEFNKNINLDKLIIQHAHVDETGKIWIATHQSVHVLKLGPNNSAELLEIVDLELFDLMIKEVRTLNKQVYILAGNILLKIPEKDIKFNTQPFDIILNSLMINNKLVSYNDGELIKLPTNKNNLLFKYQLLSYAKGQPIAYRYRLNNDTWIYTSNNDLQLASLPSGRYTLSIQGRLKDGPWSKSIKVDFDIELAFYKTWWFILGAIVTSLILTALIISWYLKRKFKKRLREFELQRELESARLMASKSQMNPHFIFNALNSIQSFILKSEKMQAYQYLNDFSALIRNYLEYSNKDYIKINKELELIQNYIKIEQLRISFHFELQVAENIETNEDFIFSLLLQPILENAIWHGLNHKTGDKKLLISINKNNNKIETTITDNGVGRKQSAMINANRISKPESVAIKNIHSRIKSLELLHKNNINVKIIDNYDEDGQATGTTVFISHDIIMERN